MLQERNRVNGLLHLNLKRAVPSEIKGTIGSFAEIGIFTLELPWLNNKPQVSCIPPGTYFLRLRPSKKSKQYGYVYEFENVPGRSNVEIHTGNYLSNVLGCIVVGQKLVINNKSGEWEIYDSKLAEKRLWDYLNGEKRWTLTIS